MDRFKYDKVSKWSIQRNGNWLLGLGGMKDILAWRAAPGEVVLPRELPDGLLEVTLASQPQPIRVLVEVGTYPEQRLYDQLVGDMILVYATFKVLPEVLAVILHPKGKMEIAQSQQFLSPCGWSSLQANWRVIEMWKVPVEVLLATQEAALMPLVPLAKIDGPPEPVLRQCRQIIDQKATSEEYANLLAVTQVYAQMQYNNADLLAIFGGHQAMIESPLIQELITEYTIKSNQRAIQKVLKGRYGPLPEDLVTKLNAIVDEQRLDDLLEYSGQCPDLDAFRAKLSQ